MEVYKVINFSKKTFLFMKFFEGFNSPLKQENLLRCNIVFPWTFYFRVIIGIDTIIFMKIYLKLLPWYNKQE